MNEKYFEAEIIISNQKEKKRVQANSKVEAIERAKEAYGGKVIKIREIPAPIFKSDFSITKEFGFRCQTSLRYSSNGRLRRRNGQENACQP